ncbi:MAG: sulfate ABC transporter permease subunit CysT [Anaerolineae bacterium]|nr:sulfate ABC transporter permease subunit CysT [Anaerolineae bacterium]
MTQLSATSGTFSGKPNDDTAVAQSAYRSLWGTYGLRLAALSYLALFILIPLVVVNVEGFRQGLDAFFADVTRPIAVSAIWLTLWTAGLMATINTVMGVLTAYVLVNYTFPGKALFNAVVDLPFAIPALVTGVMLVLLYGPQTAIGGFFEKTLNFRILFAPPGIVLALLFISYPFVIRTVQPVLAALDFNQQEAAYTLGASNWTTFRRVILPAIRPAVVTGALLSFARALGEFGSIIVVAGNVPMRSQTAAVYIYGQVEGGNMQAASAVSVVLLFIAFGITVLVSVALKRGGKAHA